MEDARQRRQRKKNDEPVKAELVNAENCVKEGLQTLQNSRCGLARQYCTRLLIQAGLSETPPPGFQTQSVPIPFSTMEAISRQEMDRIRQYETPILNLIGGGKEGSSNIAWAKYLNRRLEDGEKGKKM